MKYQIIIADPYTETEWTGAESQEALQAPSLTRTRPSHPSALSFAVAAIRTGWNRDILPLCAAVRERFENADDTLERIGEWTGSVRVVLALCLFVFAAFGQAMPWVCHAGLGDWVLLAGLVAAGWVVVGIGAGGKKGRG